MNENYILKSLLLGFFAANDANHGYTAEQSHLLRQLRFLLSRTLLSTEYSIFTQKNGDIKLFKGVQAGATPFILIDNDTDCEVGRFKLDLNGSPTLNKLAEWLSLVLDEDLLEGSQSYLEKLNTEERDKILNHLRARYEENISQTIGYGSVSTIDPFIYMISNAVEAKTVPALNPYEELALVAVALLFKEVFLVRDEPNLSDAFFAATGAYSALVRTPAYLEEMKRLEKQAQKRDEARAAGMDEYLLERGQKFDEQTKYFFGSALDIYLKNRIYNKQDVLESLKEMTLNADNNCDPEKSYAGYKKTSAAKKLQGFITVVSEATLRSDLVSDKSALYDYIINVMKEKNKSKKKKKKKKN